jgi:EpsI family protein
MLFGPSHLRRLAFPILFLLFMIPIWETLTGSLHEPFQLLAADLGSRLLRGLGIPAFRAGTYIQLPTVILEIARVCSGVNYLIAVFATSIAGSYLFLDTWPRRLTLILFAVLVAIFANSLRVALIGALSYYGYAGDSHGPYHVLQGVSVSFLGYGAIFAGLWALGPRRQFGRLAPGTSARTLPGPVESPWARWRETAMPSAGSALALLAAAAVVVQVWTPIPVELARNLQRFPAVLGQWAGRPSEPPLRVLAGMDADHELSRVYERPDARPVWLYIAYFAVQRQAREVVSYRSDALLAGSTRPTVSLPGAVRLALNEAVLVEAGQRRLVRFWYDVDGRMVADPYRAKLLTLIDALVRRRSNGALVVLAVDAPGTEDIGRARDTSQRFLEEAFPVIRRFLEGA